YRFLLARRGNQVHLRIVSNQRNDLTESSFRQIGDEVDPRLFKTLNNSFCQFVFHERIGQLSSRATNRNLEPIYYLPAPCFSNSLLLTPRSVLPALSLSLSLSYLVLSSCHLPSA